jgi:hypothetical protein
MSTNVISIDDSSIDTIQNQDTGGALATFLNPPHSPDDDRIDPADFQEMLATLSSDALEIRQSTHHPDWEHGDPCPECGNETLSVMSVDEDIYTSVDGEFEFTKKGDAIGPPLSVLCPECMTHLAHVPYQHLAV